MNGRISKSIEGAFKIVKKIGKVKQIKKTIVVVNKKHTKFLRKIKSNNFSKVIGGKTRQESTYKALKYIKKK